MARKAEVQAPLSSAIYQFIDAARNKYNKTLQYSYIYAIIIYALVVVVKPSTSNRTLSLLVKGKIQASDREMKEREEILSSYSNAVVELKPLITKLPSDTHYDALPDPGYWVNQAIALYYGKQEVFTTSSYNINNENIDLMKHYKKDVGPGNLKYKNFREQRNNSINLTQQTKKHPEGSIALLK